MGCEPPNCGGSGRKAADGVPGETQRGPSNQPQTLHAGMAVLADDDVVAHGDAEWPYVIDDRACHLDIRPHVRSCGVTMTRAENIHMTHRGPVLS